ncbi:MAG: LPS export ABC transporter periplasmic protein LptC [Duncaniella sp.]|nr:LPS export ABC transporter periplasmic protein LptC [Duncaniella sp.]MDE5735179.1 LPS export ABC transporter periplasmic protein LptC [Duncaniella sp.]MDE6390861.1 LPS export ABC transporter periplasmic protein LptC [Duncaniella sp.]
MELMRLLPLTAAAAAVSVALAVTGCNSADPVATGKDAGENPPTMVTRDVETLISDSGVVRYRIATPVWYVYDEIAEPVWTFPEGLGLEKYNDFFKKDADVRADSATYFKNKQLWRLDGRVSISNMAGEKFLTEQLFWDQARHKLYSDSFIHIERADKVLEGYGFDSNEQLTAYTIRRVSGIFPSSDFRPGQARQQNQ